MKQRKASLKRQFLVNFCVEVYGEALLCEDMRLDSDSVAFNLVGDAHYGKRRKR